MGELKDYANRNSRYIKLDDGDFVEGVFHGVKFVVKDSFGEEKEFARYKIDERIFDSMSGSLARKMDDVKKGDRIRITRSGDGTNTKYKVENLTQGSGQEEPTEWENEDMEINEDAGHGE